MSLCQYFTYPGGFYTEIAATHISLQDEQAADDVLFISNHY